MKKFVIEISETQDDFLRKLVYENKTTKVQIIRDLIERFQKEIDNKK